MKDVLIWGTNSLSKELYYYLSEDSPEYRVVGFVVDEEYKEMEFFLEHKVYSFETIDEEMDMKEIGIIPSIGYSDMNMNRERLFSKCEKKGYSVLGYTSPKADIHAKSIGNGCIILEYARIGFDSEIGDGNIILQGQCVSHDTYIGNFNYIVGVVGGNVKMGNNNFIGLESVVNSNLTIGNYNLIGAGTCLRKNIQDSCIVYAGKETIVKSDRESIATVLV